MGEADLILWQSFTGSRSQAALNGKIGDRPEDGEVLLYPRGPLEVPLARVPRSMSLPF